MLPTQNVIIFRILLFSPSTEKEKKKRTKKKKRWTKMSNYLNSFGNFHLWCHFDHHIEISWFLMHVTLWTPVWIDIRHIPPHTIHTNCICKQYLIAQIWLIKFTNCLFHCMNCFCFCFFSCSECRKPNKINLHHPCSMPNVIQHTAFKIYTRDNIFSYFLIDKSVCLYTKALQRLSFIVLVVSPQTAYAAHNSMLNVMVF